MVIKGNPRGDPVKLAAHLQKDENEEVCITASHGVLAFDDIEGALVELDAMGAALRTKRTLYHASINPEPGERELTDAEWEYSRNTLLKKLGLENQPWIEIEHLKRGEDGELRRHRHIVASRTDLEHNRAIRADHNYRKHEEVARDLERYLGHAKVQGAHVEKDGVERPGRTPTHAEIQQARRGAVGAKEARALGAKLWQATDSGKAIKSGLENHGWELARGDKRRADGGVYFVAVDPYGGTHELRRMVPVKAAELYARMGDIDPAALVSVKQAKTRVQMRQIEKQGARTVTDLRVTGDVRELVKQAAQAATGTRETGPGNNGPGQVKVHSSGPQSAREGLPAPGTESAKQNTTMARLREAWAAAKDAGDLIAGLASKNIRLAVVGADEARANKEQRAQAKEPRRRMPVLREGQIVAVSERGHVYSFTKRTTGAARDEINKRLASVDAGFLSSIKATQNVQRDAARTAWIERQREARQKARPATAIERRILDCDERARVGSVTAEKDGRTVHLKGIEALAAALDHAGIAIVRVTSADVRSVDALRREEDLARLAAEVNHEARRSQRFDEIKEGQIAAVDRFGNVHRLNPHRLGLNRLATAVLEHLDNKPGGGGQGGYCAGALPGVMDARDAFGIKAQETAELWAMRHTENARARALRAQNREEERQARANDAAVRRAGRGALMTSASAVGRGLRGMSKLAKAAERIATGIIGSLGNLLASPSKPTELQAEVAPRVAEQRRRARADAAHAVAEEQLREWQVHSFKTQQQEKDLRLAMTLGTNATAEANLGRDQYDRQREERSRER